MTQVHEDLLKTTCISLSPLELQEDVESHLRLSFVNDEAISENGLQKCEEKFRHLLERLGAPPIFTTLRVNVLKEGVKDVVSLIQSEINKQCDERGIDHFRVENHHCLSDVVTILNRGPNLTVQQLEKEVIVDLACGMAVLRGADVFVGGIMAATPDVCAGDQVSVFADIEGACRKGRMKLFTGRKIYVGNGVAQYSREQIFTSSKLTGIGILMTQPLYEAPSLSNFLQELIFPQNLPSAVCVHVLDPQPGEAVLDMCAGPGGKTMHIAALMKNQGRLVALDKVAQKVKKVVKNVQMWGITCVEAYPFDSTSACCENADAEGAPPYPPSTFDRILLDVPCSALGQRPSSVNKMSLATLRSFETYQWKFFIEAVRLLKPGGTLVYSTCTVTLAENEQRVAQALQNFDDLQLCMQSPHLGGPGLPCKGLSREQLSSLQRFDPSNTDACQQTPDNDTIGFFIAKFMKNER